MIRLPSDGCRIKAGLTSIESTRPDTIGLQGHLTTSNTGDQGGSVPSAFELQGNSSKMIAEQNIKEGKLDVALNELMQAIRDDPAKAEYRTFLFQLLCITGDWNRALTQLNVVADMDSEALLMAQTYRELLLCEAFRAEVFDGKREPLLFGEPVDWMGSQLQAMQAAARGELSAAFAMASESTERVPARSGHIDGQPFEWLCDADMRLGSALEIIISGKYYWVPVSTIASVRISPPEDLRDLVWLPVELTWINEGQSVGFMPTRYPGQKTLQDPHNALARKTEWDDHGHAFYTGSGQRMLSTEAGDFALLQVRDITFDEPTPAVASSAVQG